MSELTNCCSCSKGCHKPCRSCNYNCGRHNSCRPKIKMYYRTNISETNPETNATVTRVVTVPEIETFRGLSNRYMTQKDWTTYNKNILTFAGYRTPGKQFKRVVKL